MVYYIYVDRTGKWRWYLSSANHRKIAKSSESYLNKADCLHAISLVQGSRRATIWQI